MKGDHSTLGTHKRMRWQEARTDLLMDNFFVASHGVVDAVGIGSGDGIPVECEGVRV